MAPSFSFSKANVDNYSFFKSIMREHGGAVNPGLGDVGGAHPRTFLRDPLGVLLEKTRSLEARATPRHGHADATVGAHANDVPSGAAHPDEVDREEWPGRFGRRGAKKWEIKLHERCEPMITQGLRDRRLERRPA